MNKKSYIFSPLEQKLVHLYILKQQIEYIYNPNSSHFDTVVKDSSLFYYSFQNAKTLLILELTKVLNYKENNNLISFVSNLYKHYDTINWSTIMSKDKLKIHKYNLNKIIMSQEMKTILNLRNKDIAHDDLDKWDYNLKIEQEEVLNLLHQIMEIYNDINYHLTNTTLKFDKMMMLNELQRLEAYSKIINLVFKTNLDRESTIMVKDIMELMRIN